MGWVLEPEARLPPTSTLCSTTCNYLRRIVHKFFISVEQISLHLMVCTNVHIQRAAHAPLSAMEMLLVILYNLVFIQLLGVCECVLCTRSHLHARMNAGVSSITVGA